MYTLPPLSYGYNALEPHIDARTMEIHHIKHHQSYIDKLNAALEGTKFAETPLEELIADITALPKDKQTVVRNNGGGHANHSLFWMLLSPNGGEAPTGNLADAIKESFGSFEKFQEEFTSAALARFGSGWAWLTSENGRLIVCSTANQDSPHMGRDIAGCSGTPLLGLDVWEHAYYLHYQNRRPDYITAFWNVVNWQEVEKRFSS